MFVNKEQWVLSKTVYRRNLSGMALLPLRSFWNEIFSSVLILDLIAVVDGRVELIELLLLTLFDSSVD